MSQNQILSDMYKLKRDFCIGLSKLCILCSILILEPIVFGERWQRFNELKEKRVEASLSGYVFSTIHSDLVTELFNKETKSNTGPLRCDFSTNIDLVNTWLIRFIYIPCLKLVNPSIHKKDCQTFGLIVDIFLKLEVTFHLLLPLYLYQSQLLMESWDSQHQKRHLFKIISSKNQMHYIQFHWKICMIYWQYDFNNQTVCLKPKNL